MSVYPQDYVSRYQIILHFYYKGSVSCCQYLKKKKKLYLMIPTRNRRVHLMRQILKIFSLSFFIISGPPHHSEVFNPSFCSMANAWKRNHAKVKMLIVFLQWGCLLDQKVLWIPRRRETPHPSTPPPCRQATVQNTACPVAELR